MSPWWIRPLSPFKGASHVHRQGDLYRVLASSKVGCRTAVSEPARLTLHNDVRPGGAIRLGLGLELGLGSWSQSWRTQSWFYNPF